MNFHSVSFGVFLAVVFGLFWLTYRSRNLRSAIMLVASYLFYGAFEPWFLTLIAFSTLLDYHVGRAIHASENEGTRKRLLLLSLGANLGLLGFFKYWDWGVENVHAVLGWVGIDASIPMLRMAVPVGISFYTFQTLSYTIDIYRRRMVPARNMLDFALFVAFFPQLVAGPIVRAIDFLPQLERPPALTKERLHDGLFRIALGVGKKILIADVVGNYLVGPVYANPADYPPEIHLLMLYGFMVQIYYDFSGYSDIAIGSARLFGFNLPENFNLPYRTWSIRDFWRRWHITLGAWVRDYVYFPLGGSRGSNLRVSFNLMATMLIIGLWHGASWLWVVFGVMQGVASVFERSMELARGGKPWAVTWPRKAFLWILLMQFHALTYVCIRAQTMDEAWDILTTFGRVKGPGDFEVYLWPALLVGIGIHFVPKAFYRWCHRTYLGMPTACAGAIMGVVCGLAAFLALGEIPFIYFQF